MGRQRKKAGTPAVAVFWWLKAGAAGYLALLLLEYWEDTGFSLGGMLFCMVVGSLFIACTRDRRRCYKS